MLNVLDKACGCMQGEVSRAGFSGSYSTVYKVRDCYGEYFACKTQRSRYIGHECEILSHLGSSSEFVPALQSLQIHPQTGCDLHSGMTSVIMSLVSNPVAWVDLKHMDLRLFKSYAKCLFGALRDLHLHGFVHRDIKPSNFLCNSLMPMKCFLIDFGFAEKVCED